MSFMLVSAYFLVIVVIFTLVSKELPLPYMDEPFHYNQTLKYVNGQWSDWDPKITTLPGLYVINVPFLKIFEGIFYYENDLLLMRGLNAFLFGPLITLVVWKITNNLNLSLLVTFLPTHFFYTFLYYTDTLSTLCVFCSIYCYIKKQKLLSALVGGFAVFTRQTNIVWVLVPVLYDFLTDFAENRYFWNRFKASFFENFPHVLLGLSFLVFLTFNDFSITVGHKEFHSLSIHFAQIVYLLCLTGFYLGPEFWREAVRGSDSLNTKLITIIN